jgi:hypothetical protein
MWEGPVILIAGNIPAKLSTDIRDCREAQEEHHSNRLCSTIFIETAFQKTSWCTVRKISVPFIATDSPPANGGPTRACN